MTPEWPALGYPALASRFLAWEVRLAGAQRLSGLVGLIGVEPSAIATNRICLIGGRSSPYRIDIAK
jgi:hypothetical protein